MQNNILGLKIFKAAPHATVTEDGSTLLDAVPFEEAKAFCRGMLYATQHLHLNGQHAYCEIIDLATNITIGRVSSDEVLRQENENG